MESSTSKLILAFILLIIGVVFITQIATLGQDVTSEKTVNDESITYTTAFKEAVGQINNTVTFTVANAPTGWKTDDCPLTNIILTNSSGTAWTSGVDYTFTASTGTFTLSNTVKVNTTTTNKTNVDYTYCADDYINSSWGRTGIDLVPGFFALALLLISVGLFYSVAKENGII